MTVDKVERKSEGCAALPDRWSEVVVVGNSCCGFE